MGRGAVSLVKYTTVFLALYAPVETWVSFPRLDSLNYLVDLIGMLLLGIGLLRARRGVPADFAPILAAAFGWTGANFWRAMTLRLESAGYDARLWPEGKLVGAIVADSAAGVVAVGFMLVMLCGVGMLLAITASSDTRAGRSSDDTTGRSVFR